MSSGAFQVACCSSYSVQIQFCQGAQLSERSRFILLPLHPDRSTARRRCSRWALSSWAYRPERSATSKAQRCSARPKTPRSCSTWRPLLRSSSRSLSIRYDGSFVCFKSPAFSPSRKKEEKGRNVTDPSSGDTFRPRDLLTRLPLPDPDRIGGQKRRCDHPERSRRNGHRDPSCSAAGPLKQRRRDREAQPEEVETPAGGGGGLNC